jgi:hypothetical protein
MRISSSLPSHRTRRAGDKTEKVLAELRGGGAVQPRRADHPEHGAWDRDVTAGDGLDRRGAANDEAEPGQAHGSEEPALSGSGCRVRSIKHRCDDEAEPEREYPDREGDHQAIDGTDDLADPRRLDFCSCVHAVPTKVFRREQVFVPGPELFEPSTREGVRHGDIREIGIRADHLGAMGRQRRDRPREEIVHVPVSSPFRDDADVRDDRSRDVTTGDE